MNPLETGAREICAQLRARGFRALFAGGCVRDRLLGVEPKDFDIATDAHVADMLGLFQKTIEVGKAFGVLMVMRPEGRFEVASFRRDGPYLDGRHPDYVTLASEQEDAQRRDFTINALFWDPETGAIVDYVDGVRDLRAGVIRAVGNPEERFEEDHLRLLRAVRFAARLGYVIDPVTFEAIKARAPLILKTSAERIRDELLKILTEGGARRAFELMDAAGLLGHVLPEVARMKDVAQPPQFHPEGDVFTHTLLMLEQFKNPTPTLAMSALLHDAGKPETQTFEDRIRFNLHDKVGAHIAERVCGRLRFSADDTKRISWLVGQHMRVSSIPKMRESRRRRFVREPGFDELLELCRLDCISSHRDTSRIEWIQRYKAGLDERQLRPKPLLNGRDLIELGYSPGPHFSRMLRSVEDAQLEGTIETPESARAFVLSRWPLDANGPPVP